MDFRVNTSRATTRPLTPPGTSPLVDQAVEGIKKRGFFGNIADVFVGGGEAVGDMAKGLFQMIRHPIKTVEGIGFLVTKLATDPVGGAKLLGHAFVDPYLQAVHDGHPMRGVGRGIVEIGSLFVGPGEVAGFAKGTVTGATGAINALRAGEGLTGAAKAASLSVSLSSKSADLAEKAARLSKLGYAAEAGKVGQTAELTGKFAAMARAGQFERAASWVGRLDKLQHINVGGQMVSMAELMNRSDRLLAAGRAAVAAGTGAGRVSETVESMRSLRATNVVTKTSSSLLDRLPSSTRLTELAGEAVTKSPYLLLSPQLALSMGLIQQALPAGEEAQPEKLTPESTAAIAAKYHIDASPDNVKAFLEQVGKYPSSAIGPGYGEPYQIKQIQLTMQVLGYDVPANGVFDQATALAVVDFKQKHGIQESYRMADGRPAVNEYIDPKTAEAIIGEVNDPSRAAAAPTKSQDATLKSVAEQYGLKADAANVKAFQAEIATYKTAIGPDSDPTQVKDLQSLLQRIGYPVQPTGQFDDATAEAVITFKRKAGIRQGYQLASGEWAVNEYVDPATLLRLRAARLANS